MEGRGSGLVGDDCNRGREKMADEFWGRKRCCTSPIFLVILIVPQDVKLDSIYITRPFHSNVREI
ncbi:hypothetical protein AKJ16_DCAP01713 [Drosera capensis]